MEDISPSLQLLLDVRAALESGYSVRTGIHSYLKINKNSFSNLVSRWLIHLDQGQETQSLIMSLHPCRKALLVLLEKGLKGSSILNLLIDLESEIVKNCEEELEEQIQKLPIKLLIPILFFMFPAYLLLMLGPVVMGIITQLSQ